MYVTWMYDALLEVSIIKIALWIRVCADDWTAESAVKASSVIIIIELKFMSNKWSFKFHLQFTCNPYFSPENGFQYFCLIDANVKFNKTDT